MELKQIKELMAAMEKAGMTKLRLKEKGGFEIELERQGEPCHTFSPHPAHVYHHAPAPAATHPHPHFPSIGQEETSVAKEPELGSFVTSPMVGTFYAAPSPDDPVFVRVGDQVNENTVVCIIEAMKVMNEVKAGQKGQVVEILVESGHPVEFGTKLFRIV